jgi:hypothetical protein
VRKLLIVSPRFPPKNAPDLHRVRTSLAYYRRFGWEPTVFCLTPESSDGVDDTMLGESLPTDIEIVRVAAWSEERCRRVGFGHTDYRSWVPLFRAGTKLLERHRYDVVLFSTTVFLTFLMGPIWKRRFGCKLVYDFQDPWYHAGPLPYGKSTVPGSWWKYRLVQSMAKFFESHALKSADHVISVSQGYVKNFSTRYPWLRPDQFTVLPFGYARQDLEFVKQHDLEHGLFRRDKNVIRWVYAGRGGPDMDSALAVFFEQLAALRERSPQFARRLRVHFVGTNYSPGRRTSKVIEPLAVRYGVQDLVEEHSERIPYHQTLSLYSDSDAILLIGSNSGDYTASKFFNCVAAKKPVLALFHRASLVTTLAERFPNVAMATFDPDPSGPEFGDAVARGMEWLRNPMFDGSIVDQELAPWLAETLTEIQCAIFSRIAEGASQQ